MPEIDARRMITEFDGPKNLRRRLQRDGYTLSIKTIERWITRGRIPADWLVILSAYAWNDGRHLLLHDYLVSKDDAERLLSKRDRADRSFLD